MQAAKSCVVAVKNIRCVCACNVETAAKSQSTVESGELLCLSLCLSILHLDSGLSLIWGPIWQLIGV